MSTQNRPVFTKDFEQSSLPIHICSRKHVHNSSQSLGLLRWVNLVVAFSLGVHFEQPLVSPKLEILLAACQPPQKSTFFLKKKDATTSNNQTQHATSVVQRH